MADRLKGIMVEIGGDTVGLSKALSGVNKEINSTQSQLKDVERLLKLDPTNTQLLEQKQRLLSEAVGGTRDKLAALKDAERQAQEQFAEGKISQEQYEALQREIVDTEQKLKQLEEQADSVGNTFTRSLNAAGESLQKVGEKITAAGNKMMPLTAGIGAAGGASLMMASDFEDAMAKVSTIADSTEVPLSQLEEAIVSLSNETGIAATDIADNVYNAISAGQKTGDAVNFVASSTKLAKAGFTDSASALDILTTTLNAYGMEASEVDRVSDMLIQTQNLGKTTVGELASAMGKVIPTAKQNNVGLEQLSASYAIMTSNGIATAETTTYLNSMLNELGKGGSNVDKILRNQTGQSFAELSANGTSLSQVLSIISDYATASGASFSDMWSSSEAAKAGVILLGDSAERFNGVVQDMLNSTGSTDGAFEKMKTTSDRVAISINELKNTAMLLGQQLLESLQPVIEAVSAKIHEFAQWFSGLSDSQKQLIIVIGALVAAIGPVLIIIGKIATGVGALMSLISTLSTVVLPALSSAFAFLAANPIVLVIAAIAALVAAFAVLWNTNESFRDGVIAIWESIKGAFIAFDEWLSGIFATDWSEQFGALGHLMNAFFQNISAIWESIKKVFSGIITFIKGVFTGNWEMAWNGIKDIIGGVFDAIVAIVKAPINAVIGFINAMLEGITSGINGVISLLNKINIKLPEWLPLIGGKELGFNLKELTAPQIPLLANGAVLQPNNPFLAVVGDQPRGVNIETPLDTMVQAFTTALNTMGLTGGGNDTKVTVQFTGSMAQLVRMLQPEIQVETARTGASFVQGV